ncbi:hypothetical protein CPB84DRAFT_1742705 [Gymnopilus junonius]|uniref:PPM-type phosphatase domain-containing protein n=1 Tax=Gymnopilus junonius TaxID=109634 RepID=A0A9P5TUS6_GYMJU|nr:hypothetical protein CPB84DRAFT_1742705 [Gymnopilus junonius]
MTDCLCNFLSPQRGQLEHARPFLSSPIYILEIVKLTSLGAQWEIRILSKRHNAGNEVEANRIRVEHPNEAECVHEGRVLGLITLTHLPPIYSERVFALATPGFHKNYKVAELLARNLTPPYLSNRAEVKRINLTLLDPEPNTSPMLILCSDGLCDLYSRRLKTGDDVIVQPVQQWLTKLDHEVDVNLALDLLWDALSGNNGAETAIDAPPDRHTSEMMLGFK